MYIILTHSKENIKRMPSALAICMTQQSLLYHGRGERIDTRLTSQFPYARNFFHHIIARGGIKVNTRSIKKSYKLKSGDNIVIDNLKRYLSSEILAEAPAIDLPIVREKEDYLVVYKPKGILSHPNSVREVGQASVVGFLYHHYKDLPSIGNFIRAGLLHRLDKATDGLMIIAKTEKGLAYFKELFQQKSKSETIEGKESTPLHKYYKATSHITPEGQPFLDSITSYPHYIQSMVIAKVPHTIPKMGITKILATKPGSKENTIELNIEILTGRTHQIRYHMSENGLPIVDDYLYGEDAGGQMQLTAYRLAFTDCDGKNVVCDIP